MPPRFVTSQHLKAMTRRMNLLAQRSRTPQESEELDAVVLCVDMIKERLSAQARIQHQQQQPGGTL